MRRGRPCIPVKKDTLIGVRVTPDLADAMFLIAHRERTEVSSITRALWAEYLRQHGHTFNEKSENREHDALSVA